MSVCKGPPPTGRSERLAEPGVTPDCRIYALPVESTAMAGIGERGCNSIDGAWSESAERTDSGSVKTKHKCFACEGVGQPERCVAHAWLGRVEADKDLAGGGRSGGGRGEVAGAGGTCDLEVGPDSGSEVDALIDFKGNGKAGAGAAYGCGGKQDTVAEFADDEVIGICDVEVAGRISGNAEGAVERRAEGGFSVLSGVVRSRRAIGQASDYGEGIADWGKADDIVGSRTCFCDVEELCRWKNEILGAAKGRGEIAGKVIRALADRGLLFDETLDLTDAVVAGVGNEEVAGGIQSDAGGCIENDVAHEAVAKVRDESRGRAGQDAEAQVR
jgi:hypothetical protein